MIPKRPDKRGSNVHLTSKALRFELKQKFGACHKNFRFIAKVSGRVITTLAFAFLVWELYHQWSDIGNWHPTVKQTIVISFLIFVYVAGLFALALNWVTIVTALVPTNLATKPILYSYTETQIAKYIPGNFMHLASRYMYLKNLGISHRPIAMATILEILAQPIAALTAICLFLPISGLPQFSGWEQGGIIILCALIVGIFIASSVVLLWLKQRQILRPMIAVLARATGFMLLQGLLFGTVLSIVSGHFVYPALPIAVLAWLIGFITPGAPGGMAVREVVYVTFLSAVIPREDVLISALIFRAMTILGDLTLFTLGRFFCQPPKR